MNIAVILSGGVGSRMHMGDIPKQYLLHYGRPILMYSLKTMSEHPLIDKIAIVAAEEWRPNIDAWMKEEKIDKFFTYADPGDNRQLSIKNGLLSVKAIAGEDDLVIIHDAARPLVSANLITRCIEDLSGHDGVMPYLPAKDTFYMLREDRRVGRVLPRSQLAAGQAPEAFLFGKYLKIHEATPNDEILRINGSTELALCYGLDIYAIPGEEQNFKITTRDDLILMDRYLEADIH